MLSVLLFVSVSTSPFLVPPPSAVNGVGVARGVISVGAVSAGDTTGVPVDGSAPQSLLIHGQDSNPTDSETEAALYLRGGLAEVTVAVATAANCGGNYYRIVCNGTTYTLTEAVNWTKTDGDNATTAASLLTAINTVLPTTCVDRTNTTRSSATLRVSPAATAREFVYTTDDATCLTVSSGTNGSVTVSAPEIGVSTAGGPCIRNAAGAASAAGGGFLPVCSDTDTVCSGVAGQISCYANGVLALNITSTGATFNAGAGMTLGFSCSNPTVTCADNGNGGTAAACTLTSADVRCAQHITCNDAQGCDLTMDETSAATQVNGGILTIINVSTNACNFGDSSGVQETSGTLTLGQWDFVTATYVTDRWVFGAVANN